MPSLKTTETDALRILMISRGISVEDLAAKCGFIPQTMRNQICKSFPSKAARIAVEDALGVSIWTSASDFAQRQALTKLCGLDPFIATRRQLRSAMRRLKVRGRGYVQKHSDLISLLIKHVETLSPQKT